MKIISGLKYLHDNKVLHCNLRADNILLENSNKIKISGFLSARKLKDDEDILDLDEGYLTRILSFILAVHFGEV